MTHWHDTPAFDAAVDRRLAASKADAQSTAMHVCRHFVDMTPEHAAFIIASPRSGQSHFMCEDCARRAVTLELLMLDEAPA